MFWQAIAGKLILAPKRWCSDAKALVLGDDAKALVFGDEKCNIVLRWEQHALRALALMFADDLHGRSPSALHNAQSTTLVRRVGVLRPEQHALRAQHKQFG